MALDIRDTIIQANAPTIMAPVVGDLRPLDHPGHRYIAARQGLLVEIVRPWLRLVQLVAPAAAPLPYGELAASLKTTFGKVPRDMLARFVEEARKFAPYEHAAWIVWNALDARLEYRDLDVTRMSEAEVTYNCPALEDHESLAIDLHSHGAMPAFFSEIDDRDDAGLVKVSGVLGNLGANGKPEWKFRLCYLGYFKDMPGPKDE